MASFTSQKTVCSDAFDFLFDERNLNPKKFIESGELETYTEEKLEEKIKAEKERQMQQQLDIMEQEENSEMKVVATNVQHSSCCVVS